MPLAPGMRLGSHDIVALLGTGGMGEVYRARETRRNRDVAIKFLLPAVANGPDRLAALNHPNIAAWGWGIGARARELADACLPAMQAAR